MSKTVQGLIEFAKSKIGTPYVYGAKGTVMSRAKIQQLQNMYGRNCVWDSDLNKAGQVCVDCSGLISWYTGIIRGSGQYKSTAVEIVPVAQRSNAHIGWAVWMSGHIGIYLGNNQYIAADGSAYGVRIANLSQNRFTHLLKLCDIDYGQGTTSTPATEHAASGGGYNAQVHFRYRVRTAEDGWLPEVVNLADCAGVRGHWIRDVAIGVDVGTIWYQVHILGGGWLSPVVGYNIKDSENGYAGDNKNIDAIRVYYNTPGDFAAKYGYQKAQYRVATIGKDYWPWQFDNETGKGQDGYAGDFGKPIDRFQLF